MRLENKIEKVLSAYEQVFNEKGEVKLCGRESCKELIGALKDIQDSLGGLDFGNVDTGMMNIANIHKVVGYTPIL